MYNQLENLLGQQVSVTVLGSIKLMIIGILRLAEMEQRSSWLQGPNAVPVFRVVVKDEEGAAYATFMAHDVSIIDYRGNIPAIEVNLN